MLVSFLGVDSHEACNPIMFDSLSSFENQLTILSKKFMHVIDNVACPHFLAVIFFCLVFVPIGRGKN